MVKKRIIYSKNKNGFKGRVNFLLGPKMEAIAVNGI